MCVIKLSEKYGVNPSIDICNVCGSEIGIVMLGRDYKIDGKEAKAPKYINLGHICDSCQKTIDDGGMILLECDIDTRKRTGRFIKLKNRMEGDPEIALMGKEDFKNLYKILDNRTQETTEEPPID